MKKDNRFFRGALLGALAMFIIILLGNGAWKMVSSTGLLPDAISAETKEERKIKLLENIIDRYYLYEDEVDSEALAEGMYAGYMEGLGDKYTTYYTKEETDELFQSVSGEFFGVGALLSKDYNTGLITITQVYKDSPAEKAGIQAGDVLYQVDDKEITDESLDEIVTWIKGDKGTEVTLHVMRGSETLKLTAVRDTVQTMTVQHEMKEDGIGYIYIQEFDRVTYEQFQEALSDLEAQGMKGLVIDIRNNPGGNLDTVVEMLRLILPEGTIVSTKDRSGKTEEFTCDGEHEFQKPLAVLVNQYSASASEIFAGAVKDYGIGQIVGVTTYGKGVVQEIIGLNDGTSVKITTSEYFPPSGESINEKGITPDVEVEYEYDEENPLYDNQLEKAMETVREQLK